MTEKKEYKPSTFAEFFSRRQWEKFEENISVRMPISEKERMLLKQIFESKTCLELANGAEFWDAVSAGFKEVSEVLGEVVNEAKETDENSKR